MSACCGTGSPAQPDYRCIPPARSIKPLEADSVDSGGGRTTSDASKASEMRGALQAHLFSEVLMWTSGDEHRNVG